MKKLASLVVFTFLLSSSAFATNYVDASAYMDLEMFFRNFYEENFKKSEEPRLCDNGYFASSLAIFDKKEDTNDLLLNKLISRKDLKEAIIESMLTTFAYACPNQEEKKEFADLIYQHLVDKYDIYWIQTSVDMEAKAVLSLTGSCAVGGPEKMLLIVKKEAPVGQPMIYIVRSDVCD